MSFWSFLYVFNWKYHLNWDYIKILFKMHAVLNCSGCLLNMQKLKLNDTKNAPNKNIYFRTSFLGRIQNFSWNWYFPTRNLVLLKLYPLANMFATDVFLPVLFSAVEKHICKQEHHSWMWVKLLFSRERS